MTNKQIFIWAVIGGLALSGGTAGVISLAVWVLAFWLLEKAYDAVSAFMNGWRSAGKAACSDSPQKIIRRRSLKLPKADKRPALRVVK